jgi:hypothetical protein
VNDEGHPTVSHKGGAPGFVKVLDPSTIMFPSYDGNGMFFSMGNIVGDSRIGLLFMDFEKPHRIRVHTNAVVRDDAELLVRYPGADLVVQANVIESFFAFASNDDYLAGTGQRTAALEDSRLLPLVGRSLPEPIAIRLTVHALDLGFGG